MTIIKLATKKHNRLGFIGGSDANRIMRGDWYSLWLEKTGQAQPEDLSDKFNVQLGVASEDFNLQWFCKTNDIDVSRVQVQKEFEKEYHGVPYKGTVDGYYPTDTDKNVIDGARWKFIVECKHTYSFNDFNKMLKTYMPQLQFYMYVSNTPSCYLSVIFGNSYGCKKVSYDSNWCVHMHDQIIEFWDYVIKKKEPPTSMNESDIPTINIDSIHIDDMVKRDASKDNHFCALTDEYLDTKPYYKKHELVKKELRTIIQSNESEIYNDKIKVTKDSRGTIKVIER